MFSGSEPTQWTFSGWVKRGLIGQANYIFLNRATGEPNQGISFNSSDKLLISGRDGSTNNDKSHLSPGVYRDPSAWYHIVVTAQNSGTYRGYVNGVQVITGSCGLTTSPIRNYGRLGINVYGDITGFASQMYAAEYHFIDGQQLDPTHFGELNNDGVWVPKEVTLAESTRYSLPGYEAVFDGNGTTGVLFFDTYQTVASGLNLNATSTIGIETNGGIALKTLRINGTTELSITGGGSVVDFSYSGPINTIEFKYNGSVILEGIRVDGQYLVDDFGDYGVNGFALDFSDPNNIGADRSGNGNDFTPTGFELSNTASTLYDLMEDSPTDNYGTFNPLHPRGAGTSDADANLLTSALNSGNPNIGTPFTTIKLPESGKFYAEITPLIVGEMAIGLFGGLGATVGEQVIQYYWRDGGIYVAGVLEGTGAVYGVGDVIGVAVDAVAQTVQFYNNGVAQSTSTSYATAPGADNCYLSFFQGSTLGSCRAYLNYGQRPFAHTPPAGFEPLSTANLAAVAITNPSDHFQTLLGPGPGTGSTTPTIIQYKTTASADSPSATYQDEVYGKPATDLGGADGAHPALEWASRLVLEGYDDWYIPAKNELEILYRNLKPTTASNSTSSGANANAVPSATSNYTSGSPAQTTAAIFQSGGSQAFSTGNYWSATEVSSFTQFASIQIFSNGDQNGVYKDDHNRARAIRRVAFTGSEPAIGAAYEGGFFGGLISTDGSGTADYALIVAPKEGGEYGVATGILDVAQRTFPNGLWWIKDRANSNDHQMMDSVRTAAKGSNMTSFQPTTGSVRAYVAPTGNSVAWCWSAPELFTPTGGTISYTGTARRNLEAGFSIVRYNPNGVNGATIAHGLNTAPEFILFLPDNETGSGNPNGDHVCYHVGMGVNKYMGFARDYGEQTAPILVSGVSNTVVTVSNSTNVNGGAEPLQMYSWHSVPGYSSFGSYVGNGLDDGPFVYTGFRPAFILTKQTTISEMDWQIRDNQRLGYNPTDRTVAANDTRKENDASSIYDIDLLSNGFKVRGGLRAINGNNETIVFAAFAEHPFGGSNVSPSPAR